MGTVAIIWIGLIVIMCLLNSGAAPDRVDDLDYYYRDGEDDLL